MRRLSQPLVEPLDEVVEESVAQPLTTLQPGAPRESRAMARADDQGAKEMRLHLEQSLQAQSLAVRCQAISAIGELGTQEHLPRLLSFLARGNSHRAERLATVDALGRIGGDRAITALLELAGDSDLAVRWRAEEVVDTLLAGRTLPVRSRVVVDEEKPLVSVLS